MEDSRVYDLLIVMDATGSMGMYMAALNNSLPDIIRVSVLTGCFSRIGIVAYRDYSDAKTIEWSGWHGLDDGDETKAAETTRQQLLDFAKRLKPSGGGDWPEAAKTGLAFAYAQMRENVGTVMLLYTDAPPHTVATKGANYKKEQATLADPAQAEKYGSEAAKFADWVSLASTLRHGDKQARVYSIVQSNLADTLGPYTYLAERTGGACLEIGNRQGADLISKLTIGVLLAWMGVDKDTAQSDTTKLANVCQYTDTTGLSSLKSEADTKTEYFWVRDDTPFIVQHVKNNLDKDEVTLGQLKQFIKPHKPALADFSRRYLVDDAYRKTVIESIRDIIRSDVSAVTVNPVFGSLWRAVCSDRRNEARDELIGLFGSQVDATEDVDKKKQLKEWLEESYDYTADIVETIASVPAESQFPCVYLDPTFDFASHSADADEHDEDAVATVSQFTRGELLEIGRSCDPRILRRLGRVLTQLTYVTLADQLPAHIASQDKLPSEAGYVARIPMALAQPKHQRKFWKLLLHAVIPGTMLAPRPAALLAALSLRMGIAPLRDAADAELLHYSRLWNNIEIAETWNTNCLNLLLGADSNYEARVQEGITKRPSDSAATAFLSSADRRLFSTLVEYKLAEANLDTTLTARIGWHPEKTQASIGPLHVCSVCHMPRSVTIMSRSHVCGLCAKGSCDCATPEQHAASIAANVSKTDDEQTTRAYWVECCVRVCRAQYIVYNPSNLRVRAKCHYCRIANRTAKDMTTPTTAPYVECIDCLSRIIYPKAYRPPGFKESHYRCPACVSGAQTVVDAETTARNLITENGTDWLLRNDNNKIANPFSGRSLFYVASTASTDGFANQVEVLPELKAADKSGQKKARKPVGLTLEHKLIRNGDDLLGELAGWIASRRAQRETCSLCFSTLKKSEVRSACGRRGCDQRICQRCHEHWYGLNGRGKILNMAALACPFCRRRPTAQSVSRYGLNTLGDLRKAIDNAGRLIYAWCDECGFAREYMERVCARGAPPEVANWTCEPCALRTLSSASDADVEHYRQCPGCGVRSVRSYGCDHMTCPVRGCNTDWCYACGKAVPENLIYKHISDEHGGADWEYDDEEDFE